MILISIFLATASAVFDPELLVENPTEQISPALGSQADWRAGYSILDASRTYGFWVAQQHCLRRVSELFPKLSRRATSLALDMESTFGSGAKAIDEYYSRQNSSWKAVEMQVTKQAEALASNGFSETDATLFLDEVDGRLKGAMPDRVRETMLSFQPRFVISPASEFKEGFRAELATKGNPRAKGVELILQYPMSWTIRTPRRPNIVTTIRSHGGSGDVSLMMLVKDLSKEALEEVTAVGVER